MPGEGWAMLGSTVLKKCEFAPQESSGNVGYIFGCYSLGCVCGGVWTALLASDGQRSDNRATHSTMHTSAPTIRAYPAQDVIVLRWRNSVPLLSVLVCRNKHSLPYTKKVCEKQSQF